MKTILELLQSLAITKTAAQHHDQLDPLHSLEAAFNTLVKEPLATHCQLTSFKRGVLTVSVDTPSCYTQLYFMLPELEDKLRALQPQLALTRIKCSVARQKRGRQLQDIAPPAPHLDHPATRTRSSANAKLWQDLLQRLKAKI